MQKHSKKYEMWKERMFKGFYLFVFILIGCAFAVASLVEGEPAGSAKLIDGLITAGIVALATTTVGFVYFIIYVKIFG